PYDEPFKEFVDYVERLAHVDMGVHFGVFTRKHIEELGHYIHDLGVSSLKFFMSYKGDEGTKRGLTAVDDGLLFELMQEVVKFPGAIVNIHAENVEVIWQMEERVKEAGLEGLAAHH